MTFRLHPAFSGTPEEHLAFDTHSMKIIDGLGKKDKGYDPGRVDGAMGARTKEAIKSFQSASNLPPTGTLDAQTAEKLGVQSSSSQSSSRSSSGSTGSRDNMKSSDTTAGKEH